MDEMSCFSMPFPKKHRSCDSADMQCGTVSATPCRTGHSQRQAGGQVAPQTREQQKKMFLRRVGLLHVLLTWAAVNSGWLRTYHLTHVALVILSCSMSCWQRVLLDELDQIKGAT